MEPRPPANARVVARGRWLVAPFWLYLLALGAAVAYFGGVSASLAIAVPLLAFGLYGLASIARSRVWIEDGTLYSRHAFGYRDPIRVAELAGVERSGITPHSGRALWLTKADGKRIRLDATNLRLVPLYEELERHERLIR